MSPLDDLDWEEVREQYDIRESAHRQLILLYDKPSKDAFAEKALAIKVPECNYSAYDHSLGPKILHRDFNLNAINRIYEIAGCFRELIDPHEVPKLIHNCQLKFFQTAVGSELSCMMNPNVCWVTNVRTIWTHLVFKKKWNIGEADTELALYRNVDDSSEMAYRKWQCIHADQAQTNASIFDLGQQLARKNSVEPGDLKYFWVDAIANMLYEHHHG